MCAEPHGFSKVSISFERTDRRQARRTPPIRRMLEMGVRGAGTDATRVSSYPLTFPLSGLSPARPSGVSAFILKRNRLDREKRSSSTDGSSWFQPKRQKGSACSGQLGRLGCSLRRLFLHSEEEIKHLESVLTISGWEDPFTPAKNSQNSAACTASEPKLVSRQTIRRLRQSSGPHSWVCLTPLPVRCPASQMQDRDRTFNVVTLAYGS